jgi:ABC-type transport system involved in multi-copper enzyme maturation permease subunit
MKKYNAFWWIMGITALAYPGVNYMFYIIYQQMMNQPSDAAQLIKMAIGNPYAFPDVWQTVAFFSSFFLVFPAVVVIMLITNEYTFKTHRQNVIDGWSRSQFISSKLLDVLIITVLVTLLYFVVALVAGFSNHTRLIRDTWDQAEYIGLFALQTFSQLSIAFLIGFLVRKAFISLGIFLFYCLVFEPILVQLIKHYGNDQGKFFPLEISDRLIPLARFIGRFDTPESYKASYDAIPMHVFLTIGLTAIVWLICYRINNRRDLK